MTQEETSHSEKLQSSTRSRKLVPEHAMCQGDQATSKTLTGNFMLMLISGKLDKTTWYCGYFQNSFFVFTRMFFFPFWASIKEEQNKENFVVKILDITLWDSVIWTSFKRPLLYRTKI